MAHVVNEQWKVDYIKFKGHRWDKESNEWRNNQNCLMRVNAWPNLVRTIESVNNYLLALDQPISANLRRFKIVWEDEHPMSNSKTSLNKNPRKLPEWMTRTKTSSPYSSSMHMAI